MDIAKRNPQNPIMRPSDLKPGIEGMEIVCLLNPGVFRYNNKIWLLLRVAERPKQIENKISFPIYNKDGKIEILSFDKNDPSLDASDPRVIGYQGKNYLTTLSYLRFVCSEDEVHFHEDPSFPPLFGRGDLEAFGIEDCRVATMEDGFFLTFTEVSSVAVGVGLIETKDFNNYIHHGMIFPPHNKDCALFEEKINGKYYAFHRPSSPELGGNYIWLAESPDRKHWGNHKCVATTREGKCIIRKTKCFDFWERNVLFPKTKRSFFRTPKHPLPCPFPLNFSLLIITKKFGNLAKNRYICIV